MTVLADVATAVELDRQSVHCCGRKCCSEVDCGCFRQDEKIPTIKFQDYPLKGSWNRDGVLR